MADIFNPFNVYSVYVAKNAINSNYRLEGFNHPNGRWKMITHKSSIIGYNSLDEVVERIFELRGGDLEFVKILSEYPLSNSIYSKGGIIRLLNEVKLITKLEKREMIKLANKIQTRIDKGLK